jgi:hypothetical protein
MFRCIKKGLIINLNHITAIQLSGSKIIFIDATQRWYANVEYIEEYPSDLEAQTVFHTLSLPPKDEIQ